MIYLVEKDVGNQKLEAQQYNSDKKMLMAISFDIKNNKYILWEKADGDKVKKISSSNDIEKLVDKLNKF